MENHLNTIREARETIRSVIRDPVTKLLLESSGLTVTQLETLMADSLRIEDGTSKSLRRLYRPSRAIISRGAFNRTLIQAQNNVIRSIYTILILGHVGLFQSSALQPFLELSDTIRDYAKEASGRSASGRASLNQLADRLAETVSALARRQSFKDIL